MSTRRRMPVPTTALPNSFYVVGQKFCEEYADRINAYFSIETDESLSEWQKGNSQFLLHDYLDQMFL